MNARKRTFYESMKYKFHIIALAFIAAGGISLSTTRVQAAEATGNADKEEGFTPLFNGTNWDGWYLKIKKGDAEMANRVFGIENGIVHVFKDLPDGYQLNLGNNDTHGMVYTHKKYSKFSFKFDYKWGKKTLNNFHSRPTGK